MSKKTITNLFITVVWHRTRHILEVCLYPLPTMFLPNSIPVWTDFLLHLPVFLAPAHKLLELKFLPRGPLLSKPKLRQSPSLAPSHISILLSPDSEVLFAFYDYFMVCFLGMLPQSLCGIKYSGTNFDKKNTIM